MGKLSRSQKLQRAFDQVDEIFERAQRFGITVNPKKSHLSHESIRTYQLRVMRILRLANELYGICEIEQLSPEIVHGIISDHNNNWAAKVFIHAAAYFEEAIRRTHVLAAPVQLIDKVGLLRDFRAENRIRQIEDSTVLRATKEDVLQVVEALQHVNSRFLEQTERALLLGLYAGSRIGGALTLHNQSIILVPSMNEFTHMTARVRLLEKAGLERQVKVWESDAVEYLKSLKDSCARENTRIITMRNHRTGQIDSNKVAIRAIERNVRAASIIAGVDRHGKRFSPHSARKAFAQQRVYQYQQWSDYDLELEISQRITDDSSGVLAYKYEKVMGNGYARVSPAQRKKRILFLTALDIGHQRIGSIMSYYVRYGSEGAGL